jgi:tRNA (mo5U34)-methyltransferase
MFDSTTAAEPTGKESLQARVDEVGFWWHSIDLGQGVVTPGFKTPAIIARELESLHLPDLRGKTVLDVGAYDGYYSFASERLGADRVVALDRFVWATDLPKAIAYWRECKERGVAPLQLEETEMWQPDRLPGKRAFDTAHVALRSKVEVVVDDFMTMDIATLGRFDVTLFMGVLYHMKDPLESLRRLAQVTGELAVIETHAVAIPGYEDREMFEFYSSSQLNGDSTNWWGPNLQALKGMCRAAGFSRVEVVSTGSSGTAVDRVRRAGEVALSALLRRPRHFRAVVHAWK